MSTPLDEVFLVAAGVLAGTIGAAGGITSMVSYPALLAVGIAPLPANVTNAVALVASFPGSTLGSRPELAGRGPWVRRRAPVAVVGGACGVALLLLTPRHVFDALVPYLLVSAAAVLVAQPALSRWHRALDVRWRALLLPVGLFLVCVYSGYFGAGSGVMVLALLLVTSDEGIPRANALKNVILGVADVVAAVGFLLFGPVRLSAAAFLALGLLVGSFLGPRITRRVPGAFLRAVVAAMGVSLAAWLWVHPG